MSVKMMTLSEIRFAGLEALSRSLGPVGLIRFLQQYETGHGDYTVERRAWLNGLEVTEIVQAIWAARPATSQTGAPNP